MENNSKLVHSSHREHKLKLAHEAIPYTCDGCHEIGFGTGYKCGSAMGAISTRPSMRATSLAMRAPALAIRPSERIAALAIRPSERIATPIGSPALAIRPSERIATPIGSPALAIPPFNSCNIHLHTDCASPKRTITHPFFPGRDFKFRKLPDCPGTYCDACGRDIKGYHYHCSEKGLDLHPTCAKLAQTIEAGGGLTLKLKEKMSSKCYQCGEKEVQKMPSKYPTCCPNCGEKVVQKKRKSWSYVSTCKEYHLHVACVKNMLLENWKKKCVGRVDREVSDARPLAKKEPTLEIVLHGGKGSNSTRLAKYKRMVEIAITFIVAAVVGDPTAFAVALIKAFITR